VLERDFAPTPPNTAWVSDITAIRTYEGVLYLATVIDLCSGRVVGWSMDKNMDKHLVIGDDLAFMKEHNLTPSMSRRGNGHDHGVAERFFATVKNRVIRKKIDSTRQEAKTEVFNFIELFDHPKKRHSHTGGVSPAKFEEASFLEQQTV
jgi:putative transposase